MRANTADRFLLLVVLAGLICLPGGLNAHPTGVAGAPQAALAPGIADEAVDLDGLVDADIAEGSAVEKLTQAFPGASLVDPT